MATESPGPVRFVLAAVCLLAAGFLYLLTLMSIGTLGASDPAGNAMAVGYTFVLEFLLWIALAGFVVLTVGRARAPSPVGTVNALLVVSGAIASLGAVGIMTFPSWIAITPILMPPLAALGSIWTRAGARFPDAIRRRVAYGFAALALPLAIAPIYGARWLEADRPRREAEAQAALESFERARRQDAAVEAQRLRALGTEAPLERYIVFFTTSQAAQARAVIRRLPSRQADTVRLIESGADLHDIDLPDWELAVTPELCAAYRHRLDRALAHSRTAPQELAHQVDNFWWLQTGGCDLRVALTRLVPMIRARPPSLEPGDYSEEIERLLRFAQLTAPADQ